jgi:hypothetical protein
MTAEVYYCPTSGEMEMYPGGGFDVCCAAPELHRPTARPTDLLLELPDLPSLAAARACSSMQLQREQARHQARHIVRSGLRDWLDWLADKGVRI